MSNPGTEQKVNFVDLERVIKNFRKDSEDRHSLGYFEVRIERLRTLWAKCEAQHSDTHAHFAHNSQLITDYLSEYNRIEQLYLEYYALFKDKAACFKRAAEPIQPQPLQISQTQQGPMETIKLERLKIPLFSGKYSEWSSFKDLYMNMVHNNQQVSNVQKLQYLRNSLKGEPVKLIDHLTITNDNYDKAWKLLSERYDNDRAIAHESVRYLMNIEQCRSDDHDGLKKILDTTNQFLATVETLKIEPFDLLLIFILINKLDIESKKEWQRHIGATTDIPKLAKFLKFIRERFTMLEALNASFPFRKEMKKGVVRVNYVQHGKSACVICGNHHLVSDCPEFEKMSTTERRAAVNKGSLCFNCLRPGHQVFQCKINQKCKKCNKKHHTCLHINKTEYNMVNKSIGAKINDGEIQTVLNVQCNSKNNNKLCKVLLATAIINVRDASGEYVTLRALVDQGSQNSFITEDAATVLGLKRSSSRYTVTGIGNCEKATRGQVQLNIREKWCKKEFVVTALILNQITGPLPSSDIECCNNILKTMELADPHYNVMSKIDILLGSDIYGHLLLPGLYKGYPTAQKTKIGWILSGPTMKGKTTGQSISLVSNDQLNQQLQQFWDQEEVPEDSDKMRSDEENQAEIFYRANTIRTQYGCYSVRLPFKENPKIALVPVIKQAIDIYRKLEIRLMKNPQLHEEYNKCLQSFLDKGYMEEVPKKEIGSKASFYMPHHEVVKRSSTTTKLRVVFDASYKTPSGKSLNNIMMVGPTIQDTMVNILLRWRMSKVALAADIEQMFLRIAVDSRDTDFQRIVWRPHKADVIRHYRMKTVTFGTSSAPFIAVRTLHQLAADEALRYPEYVDYLLNDFYVDDLITGADSEEEALIIQEKLTELLGMGGFNLRKWISSSSRVMQHIPEKQRGSTTPLSIKLPVTKQRGNTTSPSIDTANTVKTLGLEWNPRADVFMFKLGAPESIYKARTKRAVMSSVARLFDPLGWLQPVIVFGKIFIQKLWLAKLVLDVTLPEEYLNEWTQFANSLRGVEQICVPRWIGSNKHSEIELHGFADASEKAMAAVIYIRVANANQLPIVHLLIAKTKVAPTKVQSIPRLELGAAELLAKLMMQARSALKNVNIVKTHYWTDSKVALDWISSHPSRWKVYIANRVSKIQSRSAITQWNHVRSEQNPADVATRGIFGNQISKQSIWWKGPDFLRNQNICYPEVEPKSEKPLEERCIAAITTEHKIVESCILDRYSSYTKLIRVVAYCKRWRAKLKTYLTSEELGEALNTCIRISQQRYFVDELKTLSAKKPLKGSSKLLQLMPFIDSEGILRVGGRLENAEVAWKVKHPVILNSECNLSKLIVNYYHLQTLHGGNETVVAAIRQQFWILRVNNLVKKCIHQCVKCSRQMAQLSGQLMGSLPKARVSPSRPFLAAGLDFAGPLAIKWSNGRGAKTTKAYIALFVCLSTKAIHLELVSDLTSKACIAAIKRFTARRGKCKDLFTDCGTNFVGANKELKAEYSNMMKQSQEYIANDNITWHFNPPSSPHFGGLWEAGVKSMKKHLITTIGETLLNVEEMYTLLAQIEACLNSRPLTPISNDINDAEALTPAHFLIGESIFAIPEVVSEQTTKNLLDRWKLTQRLTNDFWKRWHTEYLTKLQKRPKWLKPHDNFKAGQLVLVKNENTPPTKWPLARITEVFPGPDNLVRVVSLRMKDNFTKRPVHKLCPLPCMEYEDDTEKEKQALLIQNESPTLNHQENASPTSKRRRIGMTSHGNWYLPTIMLSIMLAIFATSVQADVNTAMLTSGFYVEHIGQAHVSRGFLDLRLRIPWNDFSKDIANMKTIVANMSKLCRTEPKITKEVQCEDLNEHLFNLHEEILLKIQMLQHGSSRSKRGLLGSFMTSLFGVNDEVYHDIEDLSSNQKTLIKTMDQQTKLVLRATQTLNSTNERISKQLGIFNAKMIDLTNRVNAFGNIFKTADHNTINLHFMSTYQRALNYLNEVNKKYVQVFNAVYSRQSIFTIMDPKEVLSSINNTLAIIPPHLSILQKSVGQLDVKFEDDDLLLTGHLPIIDKQAFELVKPTAIPQHQQNSTFIVHEFPADIIAVNFVKHIYFRQSEEEFKESYQTDKTTFVVKSNTFVDLRVNPNCVIKEIFNLHEGQPCPTQVFTLTSTLWKQLHQLNHWMFTAPYPEPVHAICNGTRKEILLNGTGVVSVTSECKLVTKAFILFPERRESSEVLEVFTKLKPVSEPPIASHIEPLTTTMLIKSTESFSDIIIRAQDSVKNLELTSWESIRPHRIAITSSLISIAGCFAVLITAFSIYKKCMSTPATTRKWYEPDPSPQSSSTVVKN